LSLPLYAINEGISLLSLGSLLAARGAGTLLANIPAGFVIERFGERKLVQLSKTAVSASCLGYLFFNSFVGLIVITFLLGMGMGCIALARHTLISAKVCPQQRGRALSKLSSIQRAGYFLGPIIGGSVTELYSHHAAFLLAGGLMCIGLISYSFGLLSDHPKQNSRSLISFIQWMPSYIKGNVKSLVPSIFFVMSLRMIRSSWQLLLPLWANHMGLNGTQIGVVFGVFAAMDILLLYLGGYITDHFGRKWVAIPCVVILSACVLSMPYCLNYNSLILLAVFAGVANGLGAGIIMTLGLDLAPTDNRSIFLAAWRSMSDLSTAASPLVISSLAGAFALSTAMLFSGGVGLMGGLVMLVGKSETIHFTLEPAKEA